MSTLEYCPVSASKSKEPVARAPSVNCKLSRYQVLGTASAGAPANPQTTALTTTTKQRRRNIFMAFPPKREGRARPPHPFKEWREEWQECVTPICNDDTARMAWPCRRASDRGSFRQRHGSERKFSGVYRWKSEPGGLEVSEARRLKSLEDEDRRLKTLVGAGRQVPV